jgi:hypothetical protein
MTLSDEIREPATRIGGAIRSCKTEWFEDKADRVAKLERVAECAREIAKWLPTVTKHEEDFLEALKALE